MKKTLITIFAAFALFASTAVAGVGTYGYIDYVYDEGDTSVFEFEYGMEFTEEGSPFSAVMELSFDGTDASFETATLTYAASDELSYTIGNILSYQGFESYDQTGMYQYTYQGPASSPAYSAAYAVGASVDYVTDDFSIGIWVGDGGDEDSYEYLFAYTGIEGVTAKYIYADDPGYETDNFWISYETGDWLFAFETTDNTIVPGVYEDPTPNLDLDMFLAYYAMGDAGLTIRVTDGTWDGQDFEKTTISPSYAFSDSVFGLFEYSEETLGTGEEQTLSAVEVLYTF
jgi:hypothetical protein